MTRKILATILTAALVMSSFMFIPAPAEAAIGGLRTANAVTGLPTYTMGEIITGTATPAATPGFHIVRLEDPAIVSWSLVTGGVFNVATAGALREGTYTLRELHSANADGTGGTTITTASVYLRYEFSLSSPAANISPSATPRVISGKFSRAGGAALPALANVYIYEPSTGPAVAATGQMTIPAGVTTVDLSLNIDGTAITLSYGDTAATIATKITAAINANLAASTTVIVAGANLTFTRKVAGAAGNGALAGTDWTYFSTTLTPPTLAGGADAIAQKSTITVNNVINMESYVIQIGSHQVLYQAFVPPDTTINVAHYLCQLLNAHPQISPILTAAVEGTNVITLTAKVAGVAGGFTVTNTGTTTPAHLTIATTTAPVNAIAASFTPWTIPAGVAAVSNLDLNVDGDAITLTYGMTAADIAQAIVDASPHATTSSTRVGTVVTFTRLTPGLAGNGALTIGDGSYYNGNSLPATTLSGGLNAFGIVNLGLTTDIAGNFYFAYVFENPGVYTIRIADAYAPDAPAVTAAVYATITVSIIGLNATSMISPHQLYHFAGVGSQNTWIYLTDNTGAPITTGITITQSSSTLTGFGFANLGGGVYRYSGTPNATGIALVRIFNIWGEVFHSVPIVGQEVFNPQLNFTTISGPPTVGNAFTIGLTMHTSIIPAYTEQAGLRVVTPSGPVSFTAPASFPLTLTPTMAGEIKVGMSSHFWTTGDPLTAKCLHYSREFTIKPDPTGLIASVPTTSFTVDQTADVSVRVTNLAGTEINNARVTLTGSEPGMFLWGTPPAVVDSITIDAVTVNTNIIGGVYTALGVRFLKAGTVTVRVDDGGVPPTTGLKVLLTARITVARKLVTPTVVPAGKQLVVGVEDSFVVQGIPAGLTMTASAGVSEIVLPNGDRSITVFTPRSTVTSLTLRWDTADLTTRYQVVVAVLAPTIEIAAPHGTSIALTSGFSETVSFVIKNPLTGAIIVPSTVSLSYAFDSHNLQRSQWTPVPPTTTIDHEKNTVTLTGGFGNPNAIGTPLINFRFARLGMSAFTLFNLEVKPPTINITPATVPFGVETQVTVRVRDAHNRPVPAGQLIEIVVGPSPSPWGMPLGYTNAEGLVNFMAFRAPYMLPSVARYYIYMNGSEIGFFDVGPPPPPPPPPAAPTVTASVSPASIVRGANATLTWSTTNATTVSIFPGIGAVPTAGSLGVSPTATTVYTLTATGPGGTVNFNVTLTVTDPPAPPPAPRVVELRIGSTYYKVDGVTLIMDAAPYVEFGRTFVPVRFLVTGLGGTVEWDGETKTVVIRFTRPVLHIRLVIGEPVAVVGTTIVPIDEDPSVVPVIKGGRTFVPLRFLLERITGSSIEWVPPDVVIMRLPR